MSGKGGVGKSSVAANIAYRMMKRGIKVGIIDADIYGSSLPTILEVPHQNPSYNDDKKIIPIEKDGIEIISTEIVTMFAHQFKHPYILKKFRTLKESE